MEVPVASESAITPAQAVEYLSEHHNLYFSEEHLQRLARAGDAPSHKVGRARMYRRSLLDRWALGEWTPADGGGEDEDDPVLRSGKADAAKQAKADRRAS